MQISGPGLSLDLDGPQKLAQAQQLSSGWDREPASFCQVEDASPNGKAAIIHVPIVFCNSSSFIAIAKYKPSDGVGSNKVVRGPLVRIRFSFSHRPPHFRLKTVIQTNLLLLTNRHAPLNLPFRCCNYCKYLIWSTKSWLMVWKAGW